MEILGYIALFIAVFFLTPFLWFFGGWISGWLIKITIGQMIISGLALINFNLPLDKFPLFFGTLAVIASFFKTHQLDFKNNNKKNSKF